MDKKLMFRLLWGGYLLVSAALIILQALEVIDLGIATLVLPLIVILLAIIMYSAYKLFWFGVFIPLAIILNIFDISYGWHLGVTAIVIFYVCSLILAIAFTVIFHRKGTWKLLHRPTPTPYVQHDAGNAEKIAGTPNKHLSKKSH
jgi:hypothetical protein